MVRPAGKRGGWKAVAGMAKRTDRLSGRRNQRGAPPTSHQSEPPASPPEPPPALSPEQLAQEQRDAQWLLDDDRMVAMLPDDLVSVLRGLLSPQPTLEQIRLGLAALAAVAAAMQTAAQNTRGGAEEPGESLTLDEARQLARQFLDDQQIVQRLSPEVESALRALLAASPTEEQIAQGARALAAVMDALGGQNISVTQEQVTNLQPQLSEWITTPDWNASHAYLQVHADALLTDEAEAVLAVLARAQETDDARHTIADHQRLLHDARTDGIDAAYNALLRNRPQPPYDQLTPDPEINALLRELSSIDTDREPTRADALCCRILVLDDERHALESRRRAAVLEVRGDALQMLGTTDSSAAGLAALDAAIACYDLALQEYRQDNAPLRWATTQNNKSVALREQAGHLSGAAGLAALDAAIACCDLALLEWHQDNAPLQWAMAQNNRGSALLEQAGHLSGAAGLAALDAAIACCDRALEMYPLAVQPDRHRQQTRALASLLLRRALAPESAGLAREQALDRAWTYISSALQAASDLALREALVTFRQQEWAANARVFTLAAAITALRGDEAPPDEQRRRLAQAIALLEDGRARGLSEAAGRRNADLTELSELDRQRYIQAVEALQSIEAQSRQLSDPLALQTEAQMAGEQLKQVVSEIGTRQRAHGKDFLPEPDVSLPTLARGLAAGEALVYLMPLEDGTLLLAVGPSGEPVMRWLATLTSDALYALTVQLDEEGRNACGYLPAALGWGETPLDEALDALLPRLGDDLMSAVVSVARQLGCQRAVLIAGGFLSVMPLHAATYPPLAGEPASAPDGRRYVCDDIAITYAPSGLTLLAARATAQRQARQGPAQRALVVGNPQLTRRGERWAPGSDYYLRFAEWEAHRVAALAGQRVPPFQVDLQTNDAATWFAVCDGLRGADLAHLSLHARFDADNPDRSALLVAFRSHLYLRDLLQVNLERLRLIVLSACQSGQSDVQRQSEEAVGLFGALLAAGTPAVIGTLWSVNDLATARFMESFARRAYGAGVAPDAALRAAARELRGVSDTVAAPAESGAHLRPERSVEEAPTEQPEATPAREAIARDLAHEPALAGAARQMSVENWTLTSAQAAGMRSLLQRGPEHPMYWAAFVYYGAHVSLAGADTQDALPVGAASIGDSIMASNDQRDDDQSDQSNADEISQPETSEAQRTEGYFPNRREVCPRCGGEDYLPVLAADGRNLRQCLSCHRLYTLDGGAEVAP